MSSNLKMSITKLQHYLICLYVIRAEKKVNHFWRCTDTRQEK